MTHNRFKKILFIVIQLIPVFAIHANTPIWVFVPHVDYPPSITITPSEITTVKYTVINQSSKPHTLQIKPIQGITSSGCDVSLNHRQSCILTLTVSGNALHGDVIDGPILCDKGNPLQCYQPNNNSRLSIHLNRQPSTSLTPSIPSLALSINCLPSSLCATTQNDALTGHARQITIVNNGLKAANHVNVSLSGVPFGTIIGPNTTCTGSLSANSSCIIEIIPGSIASEDSDGTPCTSGTIPTQGSVIVTADDGLNTQVGVTVVSYGCQYQGGFIYSIDDTTPISASVGGKVTALINQAAPNIGSGPQATSIIWSSNGAGSDAASVNYTAILGIDDLSTTANPSPTTPGYSANWMPCNGSLDGACNTSNILSYYDDNRVNGGPAPTPRTFYAAGLCSAIINGYSDWYLPAQCEMNTVVGDPTLCLGSNQSILANLSFLVGNPNAGTPNTSCLPPANTDCFAGSYWSSTENAPAVGFAAGIYFNSGGSNQLITYNKFNLLGVRCSRALLF